MKKKIVNTVTLCGWNGIYFLIDYHGLNQNNPNDDSYWSATEFWDYMSKKHSE